MVLGFIHAHPHGGGKRGIRGKANCEEAAHGTFAIGLSSDLGSSQPYVARLSATSYAVGLVVIG